MKKQGVVYARQSSGSDDFSESVAVQIANCRKLAIQQHINISGVFSDLNISGKTYPAGWEMLAAADCAFQQWVQNNSTHRQFRSGLGQVMLQLERIDYIIVDDITRLYRPLTRSYLESAVNQKLIENNVQILQVKGGTLDLAQFDQQLITMLKNQINDEQIAKQRQRSIEVLNKLRDSGCMPTGIKAFALRYDRLSKTYTPEPEKVDVVRFVFTQVLARESYSSIVHMVNMRWGHLFKSCFWEKSLYEIIRKPIYAGYQYDTVGNLIRNHQGPAVVSLADFLRAQEVMKSKRQHYSRCKCNSAGERLHWLPLSGFLYCGVCGSRLVAAIDRGKINYYCRSGSLRRQLSCRKSRLQLQCSKPYITGALEAVQAVLGVALLMRCSKFDQQSELQLDISTLEQQISNLEKRIQIISIEFAHGNIPENIFRETVNHLNCQLRTLRTGKLLQECGTLPDRHSQAVNIQILLEDYRKNALSQQNFEELLHEAILRIDVFEQKIIINTPRGSFELERRTVCRQKGFTAHAIGKLRRKLAGEVEACLRQHSMSRNIN